MAHQARAAFNLEYDLASSETISSLQIYLEALFVELFYLYKLLVGACSYRRGLNLVDSRAHVMMQVF
jgi:hypothetical protein